MVWGNGFQCQMVRVVIADEAAAMPMQVDGKRKTNEKVRGEKDIVITGRLWHWRLSAFSFVSVPSLRGGPPSRLVSCIPFSEPWAIKPNRLERTPC